MAAVVTGLLLLLLSLAGCATTRVAPAPGAPTPGVSTTGDVWREYERAVEDAKYPRPERVSRQLTAITTFTDGLVWDAAHEKVLMVTWTQGIKYPNTGKQKLAVQVWLSAVPFVQRFCQASGLRGAALDMRLRQRIGLPPNAAYDSFVEIWINPADFFRPCPDPEINDRECQVNLTAGTVDRTSSCPWSAALQGQVSGSFITVHQDHLAWMCSNWTSSYPPGNPRGSYPWTALGYTYDWALSSRGHIGESEFVAPKNTEVSVRAVIPTAQYCAPHP